MRVRENSTKANLKDENEKLLHESNDFFGHMLVCQKHQRAFEYDELKRSDLCDSLLEVLRLIQLV
jgi:hypothetical protein